MRAELYGCYGCYALAAAAMGAAANPSFSSTPPDASQVLLFLHTSVSSTLAAWGLSALGAGERTDILATCPGPGSVLGHGPEQDPASAVGAHSLVAPDEVPHGERDRWLPASNAQQSLPHSMREPWSPRWSPRSSETVP